MVPLVLGSNSINELFETRDVGRDGLPKMLAIGWRAAYLPSGLGSRCETKTSVDKTSSHSIKLCLARFKIV